MALAQNFFYFVFKSVFLDTVFVFLNCLSPRHPVMQDFLKISFLSLDVFWNLGIYVVRQIMLRSRGVPCLYLKVKRVKNLITLTWGGGAGE